MVLNNVEDEDRERVGGGRLEEEAGAVRKAWRMGKALTGNRIHWRGVVEAMCSEME